MIVCPGVISGASIGLSGFSGLHDVRRVLATATAVAQVPRASGVTGAHHIDNEATAGMTVFCLMRLILSNSHHLCSFS